MMKTKSSLTALYLIVACITSWTSRAHAEDAKGENRFQVVLFNGDQIVGALADCQDESMLAVQSPDFVDPLRFPIQPISRLSRLGDAPRPLGGAFRFLLTNRSNLIGELVGITRETITIDSSIVGRVELARNEVSRIMRRSHEDVQLAGAASFSSGNDQPQRWQQTMGPKLPPAEKLLLKEPSTFVSGEGVLPDQCEINIAISWLDKPGFAIAFTDGKAASRDVVSLETWQEKLVLVMESADIAETHVISESLKPNHRLEMTIYLDRLNNRIALYTPSGRMLADQKLLGELLRQSAVLKLTNYVIDDVRFGLRLDQLTVRHWNGHLPDAASGNSDVATFSKENLAAQPETTGKTVLGELQSYDADSGMLRFHSATGAQQMPLARLEHLSFGSENKRASDDITMLLEDSLPAKQKANGASGSTPADANKASETSSVPGSSGEANVEQSKVPDPELHLTIQLIDGSGLLGQLVRVQDGRMFIQLLGSATQLNLAVSDLDQVKVIGKPNEIEAWAAARVAQNTRLVSTIKTNTSKMVGSLVDSEGEGVLRWQPLHATNSAILHHLASGEIVFNEQVQAAGTQITNKASLPNGGQRNEAVRKGAVEVVIDGPGRERQAAILRNALQAQAMQLGNELQQAMIAAQQIPDPEARKQALTQVQAMAEARANLQIQALRAQQQQLELQANQAIMVEGGVIALNGAQARNAAQGFVIRNGVLVPVSSTSVERLGEVGLLFRSGDQISGTVTSIDQRGVTFKSDATTTTFASHDQLDSVVLLFKWNEQHIDPAKLKRLLTIPRSMKADPPTHLILSSNGDYLRGRLQRLDAHELLMDVNGEPVHIKRDEVAKIFWLYQRDWTDKPAFESATPDVTKQVEPVNPSGVLAVHVLDRSGRPLTFTPRGLTGKTLKGISPILNDCAVELDQVSRMFFAREIEPLVAARRTETWKLSAARTPRAFEATEDGDEPADRTIGNASPLVGKPAPMIALRNLDDQPWRLDSHHGRIVVLDFWASWCGPCMQAMPEVERVVSEVGKGKVDLIAVNLQESKEKATAALERLKISPLVVLDTDGRTAREYHARAIPQTVLIDANGAVTHVFVGGGKRTLSDLEAAIKAMLK